MLYHWMASFMEFFRPWAERLSFGAKTAVSPLMDTMALLVFACGALVVGLIIQKITEYDFFSFFQISASILFLTYLAYDFLNSIQELTTLKLLLPKLILDTVLCILVFFLSYAVRYQRFALSHLSAHPKSAVLISIWYLLLIGWAVSFVYYPWDQDLLWMTRYAPIVSVALWCLALLVVVLFAFSYFKVLYREKHYLHRWHYEHHRSIL